MPVYVNEELNLEMFPLDLARWADFETLFGARGACGGCWCMSWRLKPADFERQKGDGNKQAMRDLVERNEQVGLLAYVDNNPIGWCALAPREVYVKLENSRVLKRVDNEPVWSISCFFVAKEYRRQGISLELLKGAIAFCEANEVKIIEGYPIVPYGEQIPAAFAWTGIPSVFEKAGFVVAERRSQAKPIMRYYIESNRGNRD